MPMPTPYDSWCGGYDIINGRDARSNFAFMWGDIHFADGEGIYWGSDDDFHTYDDGTNLIFDGDNAGTGHDVHFYNATDLLFYSDAGATLELTIDGATGNIIGTATNLIFSAAGYIALIPTTNIYLGDGGITNYVAIDNAGFMSFGGNATLKLTNLAADPVGLGAGDAGMVWYNTTDGQFKGWTGAAVVILG